MRKTDLNFNTCNHAGCISGRNILVTEEEKISTPATTRVASGQDRPGQGPVDISTPATTRVASASNCVLSVSNCHFNTCNHAGCIGKPRKAGLCHPNFNTCNHAGCIMPGSTFPAAVSGNFNTCNHAGCIRTNVPCPHNDISTPATTRVASANMHKRPAKISTKFIHIAQKRHQIISITTTFPLKQPNFPVRTILATHVNCLFAPRLRT